MRCGRLGQKGTNVSTHLTLIPLSGSGELQRADAMKLTELTVPNAFVQEALQELSDTRGNEVGESFSLWHSETETFRKEDEHGKPFKWLQAGAIASIDVEATDNPSRGALGFVRAIRPDTPVILSWW